MTLSIIGTVAFDSVTSPKGNHDRILGGSGSYAAVAAHLFCQPSIISIVGQDFDQKYFDFFHQKGIDTSGIYQADGQTFHWKGYYEDDMNQAFTVQTDLNVLLEFDPQIPESQQSNSIVFCANIDPVLQKKAILQFKNPKLVILDTMNFWIENCKEALLDVLKLVDVLIINDQEARQLTGQSNLIEAMDTLRSFGPQRLIIKKGEHGSMMFDGEEYFACPALPVKSLVDPTGAGDSFAGSLAGYLSSVPELTNDAFKEALLIGACVSAQTVQGFSLDVLSAITRSSLNESIHQLSSMSRVNVESLSQVLLESTPS